MVRAARADKELMARIRKQYRDLTASAQVEEAVAEMYRAWAASRDAEGAVARIFRRMSDFFKSIASALRGHGFTTAARVFDRIERGDFGGRGDPNPTGPGGGFKASREARQTWRENLRAFLDGKIQPHETMSLGPVPEIVKAFGGRGRDLVMAASKLRKVLEKHKGLKPETIANLPDLIADPFMVLKNAGDDRSADMLIVTDHVSKDGEPVVVAVQRKGATSGNVRATVVVTLYGKNAFPELIEKAERAGHIMYVRGERAGSGYKHTGANSLNAPLSGTLQRLRYDRKIRTPRTVFKGGEPRAEAKHMRRRNRDAGFESAPHVNAKSYKEGASRLLSDVLTQAMAGKNGANLLALVPGRALMAELGGKLPAVRTYLRLKEKMDALRNEWHAKTDKTAQQWRRLLIKAPDANRQLMDLMHDSTIAGLDPSKPFVRMSEPRDPELVRKYGLRSKTGAAAQQRLDDDARRREQYEELRRRFLALPAEFRAMYTMVRDSYEELDRAFQRAVEKNAEKAMSVALRRAERAHKRRLQEIDDDGLTGKERAEAIAEADATLQTAKMRNAWSKHARLASLRKRFESNRLSGPYFPLARFGDFYVTLRDDTGKVVSFSRFEKARAQRKFAAEMAAEGYAVETGVIQEMQARSVVDPGFVADVEGLLDEISADHKVMDAVWQRWLETLPDMSIRKSKIHRKGTPGYPSMCRAASHRNGSTSKPDSRAKVSTFFDRSRAFSRFRAAVTRSRQAPRRHRVALDR